MKDLDFSKWWGRDKDYFTALCEDIIGQQLSGKVADSIFAKFTILFPKKLITPERLLKLTDQQIRDKGPSWAKVRSLKDLANRVVTKQLHLVKLDKLSDADALKELVQVKGIGPWTAEMFLIFTLHRENIFSLGDYGLNKAIKKLYGQREIASIIKPWSPYRSFGCLALWQSLV